MANPRIINLDELAKEQSLTSIIIKDGAVITDKIADGAVTAVKMEGGVGVTPSIININDDLDFQNNQALNFRLENLIADPAPGNPGRLIWRTDVSQVKVDDGVSFTTIAGGGGSLTIEDEGIALPLRSVLNFVGSGVVATDVGGKTQVSIPGGGTGNFSKDLFTVINPANKTLTLGNTPTTDSEVVAWNGQLLRPGVSNDYTISTNIVTLNAGVTLTIGDELLVVYAF